jgi:hypothetical protein
VGGWHAHADYSNTVMSFSPAGYWPLNETSSTPQAEVATNLGSLGALGNAYYLGSSNNAVNHTIPGALTDGDQAAMFVAGPSPCLGIPRTTSGLVIQPPFSVECWVYQTNSTSGLGIVACGRNSDLASSVYSGFTLQTASSGAVTFNTYNRNGLTAAVVLTSPAQTLSAWHHVVATYNSNSVAVLFVDGVQVGTTTNGYFPSFAPEIQIASQGGLNTSLFTGSLDEIAIYTNALSAADVSAHFTAGTTVAPPTAYKDQVLASNPPIYLRLDEPAYVAPAVSAYAVATNYGTLTALAAGAYQPGTTPGVVGPPFSGFAAANNYACAFNGLNALVNCGNNTALLPTGSGTNAPISVVAWFKCNPADFRFQGILGHGDSAWRIGLNGNSANGNLGWNPGLGSDLGGTLNVNDGKWHCVATVLNSTNGRVLYIDGISNAASSGVGTYQASLTNLAIGGAPDYITARGLGSTRYFAGTICQVAYFTNALTATDVSNIFGAAGITIKVQPVAQAVVQGSALTLSVTAQGPGPLGYQWYKDAAPIGGANSSTYSVGSVAGTDAGIYSVVVTNTTDSITSSVATVSVITTAPPGSAYASAVLGLNPAGYWPLSETNGSAFAVNYGTVGAAGSGRYQYGANAGIAGPTFAGLGGSTAVQFHRWGGFIDLGTSSALLPTNRQPVSLAAWFKGPNDLRFQGMIGHGDAYWRFGFDSATQKNRFNPGNGTELAGVQNMNDGQWHLLVGVSDGTTNAMYIDGVLQVTNIANAISVAAVPTNQAHAVIGGAPDYGSALNYPVASTVTVRFWEGSIAQVALFTNALSSLNVSNLYAAAGVPPAITQQPATPLVLYSGAALSLKVQATGSPALAYQWYRGPLGGGTALSNGGSIAGATTTNLVINPLSATDTNFYAVVANSAGSATSVLAVVSAVATPTNAYPLAVMADAPSGYWRLGETNSPSNGSTAYDYWAGHNGMYSNVLVGVDGYRAPADVDTAVLFGTNRPNSYIANVQGVDFSKPANNNSSFSVECWVMGGIAAQTNDAGIITKGTGAGGEQFNLDVGTPSTHAFRFFTRNAAGANGANATGTIGAEPGVWHHVVGVCDQPNGKLWLYVDGKTNGTPGTVTVNGGIFSSAALMTIGARQSGAASIFDLNFVGMIDEVAVYNYALTATQVQNHYFAAGVIPTVLVPAAQTNVTVSEGAAVTLPSSAYGSPTLRYQWYDDVLGGPLTGKTNASLTLTNLTVAANDGHGYYVVVTNAFGSATSPRYVLTVVSGPPQIIEDLAPLTVVYAGRSAAMSVTVGGTPPFIYQWQHAGTNVIDSARISGSQTNKLTISGALLSDAGTYQAFITNAQGNTLSSPGVLEVEVAADFNGNGIGWSLNSLGTSFAGFSGDMLTLTDGAGNERSSAWYAYPQYIGAFQAFFTYQDLTGPSGADGMAFVLQNDPAGAGAIGAGGGSFGYVGIAPSVGLELNIYSPNTVGFAFRTNTIGVPYTSTTPISLASGNPIDIGIVYDGATMLLDMTNETSLAEFHTSLPVGDLRVPVGGDTAYVGLTAGTGAVASQQTVSNFSYLPMTLLSAQLTATNTVLISWPASVGGYVLQSTPTLDNQVWTNVTTPPTVAGGLNQIIVSPDTAGFYRLNLTYQ